MLQKEHPGSVTILAVERLQGGLLEECAAGQWDFQLFVDPGGQGARDYNALWRPRAYVIGASGRLVYRQPDTTLDGDAPNEARTLLASLSRPALDGTTGKNPGQAEDRANPRTHQGQLP